MNPGDTFLDKAASIPWHLWVVVAKDAFDAILAFNLTERTDGCDKTCGLSIGDHPFIDRESTIFYRGGQVWDADAIRRSIDARLWVFKGPVSAAILDRIRRGAFHSKYVKPLHRDFLTRSGFNPIVVVRKGTR